jgi:hypothetical protein
MGENAAFDAEVSCHPSLVRHYRWIVGQCRRGAVWAGYRLVVAESAPDLEGQTLLTEPSGKRRQGLHPQT